MSKFEVPRPLDPDRATNGLFDDRLLHLEPEPGSGPGPGPGRGHEETGKCPTGLSVMSFFAFASLQGKATGLLGHCNVPTFQRMGYS